MNRTIAKRPVTLYVLLALLIFLGMGGLYGGTAMLIEPSGALLGMDVSYLESVPVNDYLIPGLILVTIFGIAPLFTAYGAWARPKWAWLQRLNPWRDLHWSWAWTRVIAIALILFIGLEFLMWGNESPLQVILLAVGVALLLMGGYPSVRGWLWVGPVEAFDTGITTGDNEATEEE